MSNMTALEIHTSSDQFDQLSRVIEHYTKSFSREVIPVFPPVWRVMDFEMTVLKFHEPGPKVLWAIGKRRELFRADADRIFDQNLWLLENATESAAGLVETTVFALDKLPRFGYTWEVPSALTNALIIAKLTL